MAKPTMLVEINMPTVASTITGLRSCPSCWASTWMAPANNKKAQHHLHEYGLKINGLQRLHQVQHRRNLEPAHNDYPDGREQGQHHQADSGREAQETVVEVAEHRRNDQQQRENIV